MNTGTEIAAERQDRGWSRKKLAELSGLTEGKVWRMENKSNWTDDEIRAVRAAFAGEPPPETPPKRGGGTRRTTPAPIPVLPPEMPPSTQPEPPRRPPVVVDWPRALDRSREATEQDRIDFLGPNRPDNEGFLLVSNSSVQTFKDCRRRWWLGWYRSLKFKNESLTGAAAIGNRIHRALGEWYVPEGTRRTDPRDALEFFIALDWSTLVTQQGSDNAELNKKFTSEANLERAMIAGYVEWVRETGADAELEIIGSERYLEADVSEDLDHPVKIIAKIDVRARRKGDNAHLFMDHKSVADLVTPTRILPLDEQMLHYQLLEFLNLEDADQRCDGALYNMLKKSKQTVQAKPPFYQRVEVHHNDFELENYRKRLMGEIGDIIEVTHALDTGADHNVVAYPRPTRDCHWKCDFFMICPMFDDGSRVEDMISQWYVKDDPLGYYQTNDPD